MGFPMMRAKEIVYVTKGEKMLRTPVSSSDLRSVGYDPQTQTLEIEFNSGGVYRYFHVPTNVYEGLMNAGSHGMYFHQNVKNTYTYQRVG